MQSYTTNNSHTATTNHDSSRTNETPSFDPFTFVQHLLKQNFCLPSNNKDQQQQTLHDDDDEDDNDVNDAHTVNRNHNQLLMQQHNLSQQLSYSYDVPRSIDLNNFHSNYNNNHNNYRQRFISDDIMDVTDQLPYHNDYRNVTTKTNTTTEIAQLEIISSDSYDENNNMNEKDDEYDENDCYDEYGNHSVCEDDANQCEVDDVTDGTSSSSITYIICTGNAQNRRLYRRTKGMETFFYGVVFFIATIYILQQIQHHGQQQQQQHGYHTFWSVQYKSTTQNKLQQVPVVTELLIESSNKTQIEQQEEKEQVVYSNDDNYNDMDSIDQSTSTFSLYHFVPSFMPRNFDVLFNICVAKL